MKKLLIISGLIIVALSMGAFFFAPKYFFERNILNPIPKSVENIKLTKIRGGMHPPLIASFSSTENISEILIKNINMYPLKKGVPGINQKYPGMQSIIDTLINKNLCQMDIENSEVFYREVIYRSNIDSIIFLFFIDEYYCYLKISM